MEQPVTAVTVMSSECYATRSCSLYPRPRAHHRFARSPFRTEYKLWTETQKQSSRLQGDDRTLSKMKSVSHSLLILARYLVDCAVRDGKDMKRIAMYRKSFYKTKYSFCRLRLCHSISASPVSFDFNSVSVLVP